MERISLWLLLDDCEAMLLGPPDAAPKIDSFVGDELRRETG